MTKKPATKGKTTKNAAAKSKPKKPSLREELLAFALGLPQAWEDNPWGERVAKVGKKVFVFFGVREDFGMCVKLPESGPEALSESFAEPAGYGLGKSGWVMMKLSGKKVPIGRLQDWIEESYRAVASKKLAAQLDASLEPPPRSKPRARKSRLS
jgi:predicted DNA-binding protein (MmcQ/YjbR family)